MSSTIFTKIDNQLYYGPKKNYRVFRDKSGLELSKSFQTRFRRGEVTELPKKWLYNTSDNKFYINSMKNREKFSNFDIIDQVIQPVSIFDYDINRVNHRTIKGKFAASSKTRVKGPSEDLKKQRQALGQFVGYSIFENSNDVQADASLNQIYKVMPTLKLELQKRKSVRFAIRVIAQFHKTEEVFLDEFGEQKETLWGVPLRQVTASKVSDLKPTIDDLLTELRERVEEAALKESGWVFEKLKSVLIQEHHIY